MTARVLHILSQRPARTGSGITLDAITRQAASAGWAQAAVVGVPAGDPTPEVGLLAPAEIFPLTFLDPHSPQIPAQIPFPLPGMSDVMPYPSSVWSTLSQEQLAVYRQTWSAHLERVIADFAPDIIHANHLWLVSALLPDLAPQIPLVVTCHATGLRQMELTPHLRDEVIAGCRKFQHVFALRQDHRDRLVRVLELGPDQSTVIGVGFRDEVFFRKEGGERWPESLLYVGKFSAAKGLPWLLDACEQLAQRRPELVLHIAGDGAGPEAESLRSRMRDLAPRVIMHGQLDQPALARLMNHCRVCVLPSFYEGVPLVLAEAAACGCRVVATDLPGVREQLAPHLQGWWNPIPVPPLLGVDTPHPDGLPTFVQQLRQSLEEALDRSGEQDAPLPELTVLTWKAVFRRTEEIWKSLT